ncbi:MAG: efflux RND transporter periplasmic adaptor subunit [Pseudomonadota bacterium]
MRFDPPAYRRSTQARSFLALLLALSVGLGTQTSEAQETTERFAKIGTVTTQSDDLDRVFFGRVVARQTVDLAFQVSGQILEFPAEEGATLPEGALVAQLDLEPFELALQQSVATREQAARTLERNRRLEGSAVSPVTVEDAETDDVLAEIAVRDAERDLRLATLTAPFTAIVATRNVSNFTTVSSGTPVVRLHDMSDLRIEIDVPERLFQTAGTDPNVSLFAEFPSNPERFPLDFREFNAETTDVGQSFSITLGMEPVPGLAVLPGSSVTVYAEFLDRDAQIEVPATAVILGNDGSASVMVFEEIDADRGTVRQVPIEVVPSSHGALIARTGLSAGQEIVVSGAALLEDGETVRRFSGFSN